MEEVLVICILSLFFNPVSAGTDPPIDRTLFSTKTAYDWVASPPPMAENSGMQVEYQGRTCTAIHINMLLRHGSRYPSADDMSDIMLLSKHLKDKKGPGAVGLDFIDTWVIDLKPSQGKMLNALGKQEMRAIGGRTAKRFKQLLMNKADHLEYTSSKKTRTVDSGKFFSRGLSTYLYNEETTVTPVEDNDLLRVYDGCEYFEKTVDDNAATSAELEKFRETNRYKNMRRSIEQRLLLQGNWSLSDADIEYIWEMCAFELMAGRQSTWCLFMNNMERDVMNDASDIEDYYEDSYGNDVSGEIHCVIVKKMFELMDNAIVHHKDGTNYTVGSFMFAHSATIMGTFTTLNLFKDETPLSAVDLDTNRLFRTSKTAPMSANLGFGLYSCPPEGEGVDTRYAVRLFYNELPFELGHTKGNMVWYDLYKSAFANTLKGCNRNNLCQYPRSGGSFNKMSIFGMIVSAIYLLAC